MFSYVSSISPNDLKESNEKYPLGQEYVTKCIGRRE